MIQDWPMIWVLAWCSFTAAPIWRMHFMWRALLALYLLYHELFSNRELFTIELCDACTLKSFTMLPDAALLLHPMWHTHFVWRDMLLFLYCTVNSFPTANSLPTVNSVTHTLWKNSPCYLTQLCCCTQCDAHTLCGELCSLFFYCYCTVNSVMTVNSVKHTLNIVLHTCESFTLIYWIDLLYKIVLHTFLGGVVVVGVVGGTEIH